MKIGQKVHNNVKIELMQWQGHIVRGGPLENAQAIRPKISGISPFMENHLTRKLDKIYILHAVTVYTVTFLQIVLYRLILRKS